ncbi:MAG: hypothetical protein R3E12_01035 [Candidatus Eisenbacteria bacterium]
MLPVRGSFRDPSGSLFQRDGILYRELSAGYGPDYERLMSSGLYAELVEAGALVSHDEVPLSAAGRPDAWKVLRPERIPFISYPYEWCFGELKDAALLTLDLLDRALRHDLWLKDASAYNIQFRNGRPIMIDTPSFERYPEGSPWVAYRQFCQHFSSRRSRSWRRRTFDGQLSRTHIDGVPLDLASKLLPMSSHFKFALKLHIHTHAKMQRKHAADGSKTVGRNADTDNGPSAGDDASARKGNAAAGGRGMSRRALTSFVESLRGAVRGLDWRPHGTTWSEYYEGDSRA